MARVLRTRASLADYQEIWGYIAIHDVAAADRIVDQFDEALNLLANSPQLGRSVGELAKDLRSFPVGNYQIFYRPLNDGIELTRVVHGARDIAPEYFTE
jgi:toxin ParE1/3/4